MKPNIRIITVIRFTLTCVLLKFTKVLSSGCTCESIDSFQALSDVLTSANEGDLIRLCPFDIEKVNSEEGIVLENMKDVHIQCAKEKREDVCMIRGVGNAGSSSIPYFEVFHLAQSESVTFQGFTFNGSKNGAIRASGTNFKIIDCIFEYCRSPVEKSGAIVEIMDTSSSATIVDSVFRENIGGGIQNSGMLTVSHTLFKANDSTPTWISNDETETRGGGSGSGILNREDGKLFLYHSDFVDNAADASGPAVFSYDTNAIDLGSNCGTNNRVLQNLQEAPETVTSRCDGIYYRYTNTSERKCATFGQECETSTSR